MRLSALETPYAGVAEVFHEGVWGKVCPRCLRITPENTCLESIQDKLDGPWCRDMGFPGADPMARNYNFVSERATRYWLSDADCLGTEDSFYFCAHGDWGDVDISCRNSPGYIVGCQTGKLLLSYHKRFVKIVMDWVFSVFERR